MAKHSPAAVRIGILGTRRGIGLAEAAAQMPARASIAGFVGRDAKRADVIRKMFPGTRVYDTYEQMLDDKSIDAVVVANYADEHVAPACAAMRAGKHVLSEVVAFDTIAEGVELVRTVEKTGRVYMFGENFCYMAFVQEMRRLYESGVLGEVRYAEGEYVHWATDVIHMLVDLDLPAHWRLWIPPTFYCTHSIGPILRITGERPVSVQSAVGTLGVTDKRGGARTVQSPALQIVRLSNGAIVKNLFGGPYPREPWQPWFLVGGSKGCIESNRWPDPNVVTTYFDHHHATRERPARPRSYRAKFAHSAKLASKTQHWGADFFVLHEFVKAIHTGEKPDIDVYQACDMTLVGTLGWRSALANGVAVDIPNLRGEAVRKKWAGDRYSCRPSTPKKWRLPNHVGGDTVLPGAEAIAAIRARQAKEPYFKAMYRD